MEILRFGPGLRRRASQSGAQGVEDRTIWGDPRARITEVALTRRGVIPPRSSPDMGLFIVISGGGWVQVGEERATIHHGEAVEWPPGVAHGAWTEGTEMRAVLVELPDVDIEAGHSRISDAEVSGGSATASGGLAERPVRPDEHDETEGEPW